MNGLFIAMTGLSASESGISVEANNLANINTDAFKRLVQKTADLSYQHQIPAGTPTFNDGEGRPVGVDVGTGTKVVGVYRILEQGQIVETGRPLDVAISNGPGYFQVMYKDDFAYTRAGSFHINNNGQLATSEGFVLTDDIALPENPPNPEKIKINNSGQVTYTDDNNIPQPIGQINLYNFPNDEGLTPLGSNLLIPSEASGEVIEGIPGDPGFGELQGRSLEQSNVNPATALMDVIRMQRAYELNTKVISKIDEMLRTLSQM